MITIVKIVSLNPVVVIGFPEEPVTGSIKANLPDIHVRVGEVPMSDIMPGDIHYGADIECLSIDFEGVAGVTEEQFVELIEACSDELKSAMSVAEAEYNKALKRERER